MPTVCAATAAVVVSAAIVSIEGALMCMYSYYQCIPAICEIKKMLSCKPVWLCKCRFAAMALFHVSIKCVIDTQT
jgi:hypothetical protein